MEKLITLKVTHLRLNDLGGLVTDTISRVTPDVEALGDVAAAKLTTLTTTTNDFVALLNKERTSLLTPQIAEKDQQRGAGVRRTQHE
jgi:hypothetical protein